MMKMCDRIILIYATVYAFHKENKKEKFKHAYIYSKIRSSILSLLLQFDIHVLTTFLSLKTRALFLKFSVLFLLPPLVKKKNKFHFKAFKNAATHFSAKIRT